MPFINNDKLNNKIESRYHDGIKEGLEKSKRQVSALESNKRILEETTANLKAEIAALKDTRIKARDIKRLELELEIQSDDMEAQQALLDAKQKRLDSRIKDLEKEEADQYKKGYADGVADGLRKVTELTEQDRNNMTKIAMVSAARGTDAAQIQGVTDVLQLTSSNSDK